MDTKISALKVAAENNRFIETLTKTIEVSAFEQGIFPEYLKLAKLVPIHKEGSKVRKLAHLTIGQ